MKTLMTKALTTKTLRNAKQQLKKSAVTGLLVKMFLMSAPGSYGSKVSGADLNLSLFITNSTSGFFSQGLDGFSIRGGCLQGYVNVQGDGVQKAQSTQGWSS